MANKKKKKTTAVSTKPKLSKRQRRVRLIVYIMVFAMLLSVFTFGAAMFL